MARASLFEAEFGFRPVRFSRGIGVWCVCVVCEVVLDPCVLAGVLVFMFMGNVMNKF